MRRRQGGDAATVAYYDVRWKLASETNYSDANIGENYSNGEGSIGFPPLIDGETYDVQVRARNSLGLDGPWSTAVQGTVGTGTASVPTPFAQVRNRVNSATIVPGDRQLDVSWSISVNPRLVTTQTCQRDAGRTPNI